MKSFQTFLNDKKKTLKIYSMLSTYCFTQITYWNLIDLSTLPYKSTKPSTSQIQITNELSLKWLGMTLKVQVQTQIGK